MLSNFNEETQKIILMAKKEMTSLKHPYVGSEHLLLAILNNRNLSVTKFLNECNVTYESFRNEIINIVGYGSECNNWFLFTPLLKRVISNAILQCRDKNIDYVNVDELFLSLLSEGEGVAIRILMGLNIDIKALYDRFNSNIYLNKSVNEKNLLINDFAVDLSKNIQDSELVGRDDIINRIISIFLRKSKNNPLLIGDAGVGKTAIVEELSRRICKQSVPNFLKNKKILSISTASLVAGTKYRGEFEERINKIIKDVESCSDIILFIDEIHTLVGAGGADGAIDASNILKPYLARGKIKIIGATTNSEYLKYISKDKAFDRRFQKIYVNEPNYDETLAILNGIKVNYEKFHNVIISKDILNYIVKFSERFIKTSHQPDKAIDLLDDICCKTYLTENDFDKKINKLKNKISVINNNKNESIRNNNYKEAIEYNTQEKKLISKLNKYELKNNNSNIKRVDLDTICDVLYYKTNIPIKQLLNFDSNDLISKLTAEMIGREKQINKIVNQISYCKILDYNCKYSFLLIGGLGSGKKYFVKKFVEHIYHDENFFHLNMNEFTDSQSITKIVGAAPGYVGYNEKNSFLDRLKFHPFSVILIENIEKANKNILNLFVCALKNGYIINSLNEKIDVSNVVFFFTSNINFDNKKFGFINDNERTYKDYFQKYFEGDFLALINDVIYFESLNSDEIKQIIKKKVSTKNRNISLTDDDLNDLVIKSNYKKYGALLLDRLVDNLIYNNVCL